MIRLEKWSEEARLALSTIEGLSVENIEREVTQGVAQLWHCGDESGNGGYVVTRVDVCGREREWVWLACAGRGYHRFVQAFIDAAKSQNLSVRVYVRRSGMRRIYEKLGFTTDATVMRRASNVSV